MEHGKLASGPAMQMGKVATIGLAPVVFSPLMNITGFSLATWWRNRTKPPADLSFSINIRSLSVRKRPLIFSIFAEVNLRLTFPYSCFASGQKMLTFVRFSSSA